MIRMPGICRPMVIAQGLQRLNIRSAQAMRSSVIPIYRPNLWMSQGTPTGRLAHPIGDVDVEVEKRPQRRHGQRYPASACQCRLNLLCGTPLDRSVENA
jgi:hypothetical protein